MAHAVMYDVQCCQAWRFSPRFKELTLVRTNFSLDLGNLTLEMKCQRNRLRKWEFLRVFSNIRKIHLATLVVFT